MQYERLIKGNRIKIYNATSKEINDLLNIARRDLRAAARNLEEDPDWAYGMAYNSILQACRALMMSEGYRPRGADQHASVVEFTKERLGSEFSNDVNLFDQMRRKRHRVIYETTGLIGDKESHQVLEFSKAFVQKIFEIISKQIPLDI
jgi:uncharacterized protein (UPF0332 family)